MKSADLQKLLDTIQAQIRAFDTKAQVALGVDGLLAGFLGNELLKFADFRSTELHVRFVLGLTSACLALACTAVSFVYALRTIHPKLHLNQPESHFFFCFLANQYSKDFRGAAAALKSLSEEEMEEQLGTQIQTNAVICDAKAGRCQRAMQAAGLALACYLVSLLLFAIVAFHTNPLALAK